MNDIIKHNDFVRNNIMKSFNNEEIVKSNSFKDRLSEAKKLTNTNPSEQAKQAGNYKKGHVKFGGYEYVIENPKGSKRSGIDADGNKWSTTMKNTYGYFLGTIGKDKDHIDVFINDAKDLDNFDGNIYIVDQYDKNNFDEHKIMYGFDNKSDAKNAYLSNYSKGWKGLKHITGVNKVSFDKWIGQSKRKIKPFFEYNKQ